MSFDAEKKFNEIYDKNQWGQGSGEGSMPKNTKEYRKFLQQFLKDYKIRSMIDLGCGDWQSTQFMDHSKVDYTGIDVVGDLIKLNNEAFGAKNIRFLKGDITKCHLPEADLIVVKDVLQHWPTPVVKKFLRRVKHYKYVMLINDNYPDPTLNGNPNPEYGFFRPLSLLEPPFSLKGESIFKFRTDPKMPAGFKNKEVILLSHTEQTRKYGRLRAKVFRGSPLVDLRPTKGKAKTTAKAAR